KALDVNGNRISGSVTVKTGSGYSAELYCYDSDNRITHSGTASDVSIVTGKETKITILLQPGLPETPLLTSLKSSVSTDSTYILTWSEVNNAKSYTIEESPDSIFTDPLKDSWFSK
ncbi:MAG: hypothetical protein JXB48_22175, partial [Candidatus Latescibacteria bacterium]|nr:hypothetical protein [Candidatus Latescibacterota bacterium]